MAYRISNNAGTSFNLAANWDTGVNTPTVHASTSISITAGGVFSATTTAPNTVNAATGVLVKFAAVGTAGTITAALQEFNGVSWSDVATSPAVNITDLRASTNVFFQFSASYVFTTTTAGRYRVKLNTSGASGTTSCAADSGGSNFMFLLWMNSNVIPTTGDDFYVAPANAGSFTMDLDVDITIGSGTNTSTGVFRSVGNAYTICDGAVLAYPTSTNRTMTLKGNPVIDPGGELRMGTTASPVQIGVLARHQFDQNAVTCNYGLTHVNGAKISLQGEALTYKKSTIVSGAGTAASPLVLTDTTGWAVGMELVIPPSSDSATNYDETEIKFIRTISGTDVTLAATAGGAESGLTYNHDGAPAFNVTRPILWDTTDTTKAWYADFNETGDVANLNFDGVRFETIGSGVAGRTTLTFSNLSTELFTADDVVFYRILGTNGITFGNNNDARTFTWLLFVDYNGVGNAGALFLSSMRNKRFENCYVVDSLTGGFYLGSASACDFVECAAYACGRTTTTSGGWRCQNASNIYMQDCEAHANRSMGTELATMPGLYAFGCEFGTKGVNQGGDISCSSDNYNTALFEDCMFGSASTIVNYTNAADGTDISFHRFNQTDDYHFWYTKYGKNSNAGAGLADTTVKTAGNHSVKMVPENATVGLEWKFKVLARANKFMSASGFIRRNTTYSADEVTVELYLPGLVPGVDTPSDSVTMPTTADTWHVFNLAASYTGSVPKFGTCRVVAKSTTGGAVYVADIANGTNDIIGLNVWDEGKPSSIMFEQLGDAAAVWSVLVSTLTTSGTIGYFVTKLLTVAKFLGLR